MKNEHISMRLILSGLVLIMTIAIIPPASAYSVVKIAQYDIDEGSGSDVEDSTVNNYDCVLDSTYTPDWDTKLSKTCLYFDGGSQFSRGDHVNGPSNTALDLAYTPVIRIYAKIWIIEDDDDYHVIADKHHRASDGKSYGWTLYLTEGKLRFRIYHTNIVQDIMSNNDVPTGEWVWLYVTWDGDDDALRLYWVESDNPYNYEYKVKYNQQYAPSASSSSIFCIGMRHGGHGGYMPFHGWIGYVSLERWVS